VVARGVGDHGGQPAAPAAGCSAVELSGDLARRRLRSVCVRLRAVAAGLPGAGRAAALVAELRRLLQELGTGFAIVGERSPLVVGDSEFFPDLLCYHTRLHRYVVFELKLGRFDPRDLGQLQVYVQAVDHQVRDELIDAATIGVLLVADHDDTVVQYALQASTAPVAVPEDVRASMPADEVLIAVGRDVTLNWTKNAGVTSRDNRDCWVRSSEFPCDAGFRIALMHALPSTTVAFILILSVCLRW